MKTEKFSPSDYHWRVNPNNETDARIYPIFTERITLHQARYLLLNQPKPIIAGRVYDWKVKHIGCGVYELSVNFGKK